jgi:hypothetical protein
MQPDIVSSLALPAKMAGTAAFVFGATRAAERAGPLVGAMVATLPLSAGPAYLFLALDHNAAFIAASALGSLAGNAANVAFCLAHAVAAQRFGLAASLPAALAAWAALVLVLGAGTWTLAGAIVINLVVIAVGWAIATRLRRTAMPVVARRWYDAPLRAGLVALLVAVVVGLGARLGPRAAGILALFPVVLTSLVLILQPRIGGRATASLTANAILGFLGFGAALVTLHLAAGKLGIAAALMLGLAVSVGSNLAVVALRRRPA